MKRFTGKDAQYYNDLVLSIIPNEPNYVSSKDIANILGMNSREVRIVIQRLRDDGYPICATPEKGYWLARSSFDMNETLLKMKSHIDNCINTYNSLIECRNNLKKLESEVEKLEGEVVDDGYNKLLVQ